MKGQNWNGAAIRALFRVFLDPSLCLPHARAPTLSYICPIALKTAGIRGIVLDKDNTVTSPYGLKPHHNVSKGFQSLCEAFPGRVVFLSNSAGTVDDEGSAHALEIEDNLGIPVIRHSSKKPSAECLDEILTFFQKSLGDDETPFQAHELCMMGDRLLTDIVFGNLYGLLTVHVLPLSTKGDNGIAARVRHIENNFILKHILKKGSAPPHRLLGGEKRLKKIRKLNSDVNSLVGLESLHLFLDPVKVE